MRKVDDGMSTLRDKLLRLEDNISEAARRAGRTRDEILLVAVTKGVEIPRIQQVVDLGVEHIGENRVQEAQEKWSFIRGEVTWHMVGHLQSNKVRPAVELFSWIHSLDRPSLLRKLAQQAEKTGKLARVLIQVNTSREKSKSGIRPERAEELVLQALENPGVRVEGLMTMGPSQGGPEAARPGFAWLRKLAEEIRAQKLPGGDLPYLSMGMSADYVAAILEGANMLRIGTAIFGPRR